MVSVARTGIVLGVWCMLSAALGLGSQDPGGYPEPASTTAARPTSTYAPTAMVAAAHPLAAKAGTQILKSGGNAIDAMVAVQMVLTVVEPQSSGIGGGCFIMYHDAKTAETFAIDGREETPAGASRGDFLDASGKVIADAITGAHCAGVPGTVAAMHLAHARWGKLPWPVVLEPARRLAAEGIGVTPRLRLSIEVNRRRFLKFPSSRATFLDADGEPPEIGTVLKQPDLARTFALLADAGPDAFYRGPIARAIVRAVRECPVRPGKMTLEDLDSYRAVYRQPVRFRYHGHEIVGMPPPSSGTLTLGLMCDLLSSLPAEQRRPGTLEEINHWARIESLAFADRNAYLGDADFSDLAMSELLAADRLRARRADLLTLKPGAKARPGPRPGGRAGDPDTEPNPTEGRDTSHFSIVDQDRNVVSCTTTIEHGMGCGYVVPGAGFLLNNELSDFDLGRTTGPNVLDPTRRPRRTALSDNTAPAGKRPRSSMTPIIVFKDGKPYLTLGSPGGAYIIGVVGQTLVGVLDHGLTIQDAISLPRVSCRNTATLSLEDRYPNRHELILKLEQLGWRVMPLSPADSNWGGAHGIRLLPDGRLEGGYDPRREGAVRGF